MKPNTDGKLHAQRRAFALASQLKSRFNQRGISEADFWQAVKVDCGVESRSQINELGYVKLAARLDAAKRHRIIFDEICRGVVEKNCVISQKEQTHSEQPENEAALPAR